MVHLFSNLVRRQIGTRTPTVEYISSHSQILFMLLKGWVFQAPGRNHDQHFPQKCIDSAVSSSCHYWDAVFNCVIATESKFTGPVLRAASTGHLLVCNWCSVRLLLDLYYLIYIFSLWPGLFLNLAGSLLSRFSQTYKYIQILAFQVAPLALGVNPNLISFNVTAVCLSSKAVKNLLVKQYTSRSCVCWSSCAMTLH